MRKYIFLSIGIIGSLAFSQHTSAQRVLSLGEAEELFKHRNMELVVATQKGEIESEAAIKDAKLLNNPELSLSGVNLWSNSHQRDGERELIPPLVGRKFGRNMQFEVELSQEIRLGGERRKNIRKEKANRLVVDYENMETTQVMLLEFKERVFELNYTKEYTNILQKQMEVFETVIQNYKKQLEHGYISQTELLRIQAEALQLEQEYNEAQRTLISESEEIQSMLGLELNDKVEIVIPKNQMRLNQGIDYLYTYLFNNSPTLLKTQAQIEAQQRNLRYEKSVRIPNMTFSASYDRFGGVWKDYIGFGVSFQLPVFNRNQANTKAAIQLTKLATFEMEQEQLRLQNKIQSTYTNYQQILNFLNKLEDEPIIAGLDDLLVSYQTNILKRNISLIEFLDFMETFKDTKNVVLETQKELYLAYSVLESTIGVKLN